MRFSWVTVFGATTLASMLIAGCGGTKKPGEGAYTSDSDAVYGTPLPDRQDGVSFLASNVNRSQFEPVRFGFDSYVVDGSEMSKVEAVAGYLRTQKSTVIIAGFTDERGTPEYNRGLGERRALAVREALLRAGVDAALLQTVSFGEEMPEDPSSGEAAWARNRRAEFGVVRR
jgi:peptidoglycan-associated lipoprotein